MIYNRKRVYIILILFLLLCFYFFGVNQKNVHASVYSIVCSGNSCKSLNVENPVYDEEGCYQPPIPPCPRGQKCTNVIMPELVCPPVPPVIKPTIKPTLVPTSTPIPTPILAQIKGWFASGLGDSFYFDRIDIELPNINMGQSWWMNIKVYNEDKTLVNPSKPYLKDYHVCAPGALCTSTSLYLYFEGTSAWPHSYYRFHGTIAQLRARGLPEKIVVRAFNEDGTPYSDFSEVILLTSTPPPIPTSTTSPTITPPRQPPQSVSSTPVPTKEAPTIVPTSTPIPSPCITTRKQGDANCDGKIDTADFNIISIIMRGNSYPRNPEYIADFNKDSIVNLLDFEIWRNTYYSQNTKLP